jgi:hypothetical protein
VNGQTPAPFAKLRKGQCQRRFPSCKNINDLGFFKNILRQPVQKLICARQQKSRPEGRLENPNQKLFTYLRRRMARKPTAPKPTNASVAGSGTGTGCKTRLSNVTS